MSALEESFYQIKASLHERMSDLCLFSISFKSLSESQCHCHFKLTQRIEGSFVYSSRDNRSDKNKNFQPLFKFFNHFNPRKSFNFLLRLSPVILVGDFASDVSFIASKVYISICEKASLSF